MRADPRYAPLEEESRSLMVLVHNTFLTQKYNCLGTFLGVSQHPFQKGGDLPHQLASFVSYNPQPLLN